MRGRGSQRTPSAPRLASAHANKEPKYSIELARPAGFEPATRCLEGTVEGSREVAWRRPTRRLAADTIAGNRVASLGVCRWWLPAWLPEPGMPGSVRGYGMRGGCPCGRRQRQLASVRLGASRASSWSAIATESDRAGTSRTERGARPNICDCKSGPRALTIAADLLILYSHGRGPWIRHSTRPRFTCARSSLPAAAILD